MNNAAQKITAAYTPHAKQEVKMADEQAKRKPIEPTTADQKPASSLSSAKMPDEESIAKPGEGGLEKFRSKHSPSIPGVETLLTALPHHTISQAGDYVRLHPDETKCWSPELCFVNVPIKGMKRDTLHLINEELAMQYLPSARIKRFRLAMASNAQGVFFLCHVPTRNLDNSWNRSNMQACEEAKTYWIQSTSRKEEGVEAYQIDRSRDVDAFREPNWPKQTLEQLILVTFNDRMIDRADHPGLLRLIGAKQSLS
jgi:hypothetical protein